MWRLQDSVADLALSLLILVILTIVAVFVIVRVRRVAREEEDRSGIELLSKFRDVHARGGLSDAEFRTIKTRLADRVMEGLKDKEEKA